MDMHAILPWLIGGMAIAVFIVLIGGIINMSRKTPNPKRANLFMRWRVGLQGLALLLLILFLVLFGKG